MASAVALDGFSAAGPLASREKRDPTEMTIPAGTDIRTGHQTRRPVAPYLCSWATSSSIFPVFAYRKSQRAQLIGDGVPEKPGGTDDPTRW